jgi:hypothetical protein
MKTKKVILVDAIGGEPITSATILDLDGEKYMLITEELCEELRIDYPNDEGEEDN